MSDKIRWALLTTAKINNALIDPIRQSERSELVAVGSRNLERAQAYAQEKGIPKAHGSYEELLADPDIDVIYNALPNGLHCEWTIKAAEAGKHVLCEKPLVISMEEFDQVESAAVDGGVTIFEAFMYLHHPQTRKVREMIDEGQLGQIQLINSWFNFYLPPENAANVRLQSNLEGGAAWDVGVYPNSMAVFMTGGHAPSEVWADQIVGESNVDVAMRAQLKFRSGTVAQVSSGFRTAFREAVYIVGDKGTINIIEPWKPGLEGQESRIILSTIDDKEETITFPAVNPYLCEVQAMEACVLDGAEPVVPLSLSREFLKSMLATYQSAASGQVVKL
ncbi:MAG TPA: Gfo/Idh/MocA family oxidoreductase [Anaerolineae bacterium]|nr:Gfo/Idh/MocA family oxidoreductase [Anaerolineae bacterium]